MHNRRLPQAKGSTAVMPSPTNEDDAMKALRVHCLQIEATQANKTSDPKYDEYLWFEDQKPLNTVDRDDSAFWALQASLFKIHFDRNGIKDEEMFGNSTSPNPKQMQTKTPASRTRRVRKQVRFFVPGSDFTPETVTCCPLPQHNELRAAARTRTIAAQVGKKQLEEANSEYERAYQENLMEMEYGPNCYCNRHVWQHELHPSGTVKRSVERGPQSDDVEMAKRNGT